MPFKSGSTSVFHIHFLRCLFPYVFKKPYTFSREVRKASSSSPVKPVRSPLPSRLRACDRVVLSGRGSSAVYTVLVMPELCSQNIGLMLLWWVLGVFQYPSLPLHSLHAHSCTELSRYQQPYILRGVIYWFSFSANWYFIDTYGLHNGSSAFSATGVTNYVLEAAFPLFTLNLYEGLGIDWATAMLAIVTVALMSIPWVLFKYDKDIKGKGSYDNIRGGTTGSFVTSLSFKDLILLRSWHTDNASFSSTLFIWFFKSLRYIVCSPVCPPLQQCENLQNHNIFKINEDSEPSCEHLKVETNYVLSVKQPRFKDWRRWA